VPCGYKFAVLMSAALCLVAPAKGLTVGKKKNHPNLLADDEKTMKNRKQIRE
jgi:hypothetical protein